MTNECKNYLIIFLIFSFFILLGCARTVTSYVTYGNQMVVEVTLRGTMETNANRYFLVLGSAANYKVPLPRPDNIAYEFLEPGTPPKLGTAEAYYTNYYSTWAGYVIIEPGGYFTVKGPFTSNQAISREVLASLGESSATIRFTFSLERIFGASIPTNIYFDFVTVGWPNETPKYSEDHLLSTNAYISKAVGSTQTITDLENDASDPALDILSCTVTIQ